MQCLHSTVRVLIDKVCSGNTNTTFAYNATILDMRHELRTLFNIWDLQPIYQRNQINGLGQHTKIKEVIGNKNTCTGFSF